MVGRKPIEIGERSGHLVVLSKERHPEQPSRGRFIIRCLCEACGKETSLLNMSFRRRTACLECTAVRAIKKRTKHGGSVRGAKNPLYGAWQQMNNRCSNPNTDSYEWYGAKGITVCDEWKDYAVFREWAMSHGYAPGMTLDRLNEMAGYGPDNCEYVSRSENSRRMRKQYKLVKVQAVSDGLYNEDTYGDY